MLRRLVNPKRRLDTKLDEYRLLGMKIIPIILFTILFPISVFAGDLSATKQAASEGNARAQYDLAILYLKGNGVEKNSAKAINLLEQSAEQEFKSAQYKLGQLYREGRKVDTDMDKAIEYFTLASDQGSASAQYVLGEIYLKGEKGIEKDLDEAEEWFELSAGHGFKKAQRALDALTENEESDAIPAVNVTSTTIITPIKPTTLPAYEMGMKYLRGEGVNKSYKQAAKFFSQAAETGNAKSQYQLAELLNKGKGVKRNKKLAKKWYRAAAKQGHIKAKNRLDGCGFC